MPSVWTIIGMILIFVLGWAGILLVLSPWWHWFDGHPTEEEEDAAAEATEKRRN